MTSDGNETKIQDLKEKLDLSEENCFKVTGLSYDKAINMLKTKLNNQQRDLQNSQWTLVENKLKSVESIYPLHVNLLFDIIVKWSSTYTPTEGSVYNIDGCDNIKETIKCLFKKYELHYGPVIFSHCVFYLTIFKNGIAEHELDDILSLDDEALNDVFEKYEPPIRRFPTAIWLRLRDDMKNYLSPKFVDKIYVVSWNHQSFSDVAKEYYKNLFSDPDKHDVLLQNIIDYFTEAWRVTPKEYLFNGVKKSAPRYTKKQNLKHKLELFNYDLLFNERKLNELLSIILLFNNNKTKIKHLTELIYLNYEFMHCKAELGDLDFIHKMHEYIGKLNDQIFSDLSSDDEIKKSSKLLFEISNIYINNYDKIKANPDLIMYEIISRLADDEYANKMRGSIAEEFALIPLQNGFNDKNEANKNLLNLGDGARIYGFISENHVIVKNHVSNLSIVDITNQTIKASIDISSDYVLIGFNKNIVVLWTRESDDLKVVLIKTEGELQLVQLNNIKLDFIPKNADLIKFYEAKENSNEFILSAFNSEKMSAKAIKYKLANNEITQEEFNEYSIKSNQNYETGLPLICFLTSQSKFMVHISFNIKKEIKSCVYQINLINNTKQSENTKEFKIKLSSQNDFKPQVVQLKNEDGFVLYNGSGDSKTCYLYLIDSNLKVEEHKLELDDEIKDIELFNEKLLCFKCHNSVLVYDLVDKNIKKFISKQPELICITSNSNYLIISEKESQALIRVLVLNDLNIKPEDAFTSNSQQTSLNAADETKDIHKQHVSIFERKSDLKDLGSSLIDMAQDLASKVIFDLKNALVHATNIKDRFKFSLDLDLKSICCNEKYITVELDKTHQLLSFSFK